MRWTKAALSKALRKIISPNQNPKFEARKSKQTPKSESSSVCNLRLLFDHLSLFRAPDFVLGI
jgi:hypothetical protein